MSYIFNDDKPPPRRASSFADTIQTKPYRAKGLDEQGRYPEAAEPATGPLTVEDLDRAIADKFPGGRLVRPAEAVTEIGADDYESGDIAWGVIWWAVMPLLVMLAIGVACL